MQLILPDVSEFFLPVCVISECVVVCYLVCRPDRVAHWYFSRSAIFLMVRTLASSGDPFSLMNILQFVVQVPWIFPSFLRCRAFLAISALCLVRCSLIKTLDPFNFLPCFSSVILCFRFTNLNIIAGMLPFLLGRGWHASTELQSRAIPLDRRKAATCCSVELMSFWNILSMRIFTKLYGFFTWTNLH